MTLFGKKVKEMQSDVEVSGNRITGTLKFIEGGLAQSGPLAGDGNFLALKFDHADTDASSIKVGLRPTYATGEPVDDDSGLVELLGDPDMNGVFKINNSATQKFKVVITVDDVPTAEVYDLSGLVCETE